MTPGFNAVGRTEIFREATARSCHLLLLPLSGRQSDPVLDIRYSPLVPQPSP